MRRTALQWVALALVGLLPRPGQAYTQARAQAHTPAHALGYTPAPAELFGEWVGYPVGAAGAPDSTAVWHLILRADSTYIWKASDFQGSWYGPHLGQRWRALRGDTLTLDSTHVYTVRRTGGRPGTREPHELWLTELTASGAGAVFRLARDWTSTAITGRPLKCTHGRIQSFACANVELLSYLPREAIGRSAGADLWGWHDSTTGREFLISGGDATAFIEVTDPVHPKYLGVLPPHDNKGGLQSVKVYRHYAFITFEGADLGLQIFDLRQLRTVKQPTTFHETAHYDGFGSGHTLTLNPETGLLTANWGTHTCGRGLHMVDVRTPTQPVFAGCYTERTLGGEANPGAIHDAQCVVYRGPDRDYQGREICVSYAINRVSIADVTDRKNPKTIGIVTYPNIALAHQGWFTEDQRYVFLDDEGDEGGMAARVGRDSVRTRTIGLDLTDLDEPVVLVEYYNPKSRTTDHNLYIRGRYMYQGNYAAGLRIIDIADPKAPQEAGYLSPKHNDANDRAYSDWNGAWVGPWAWGTYPYLKHGVVAVSLTSGVALVRLLKP